MRDRTKPILQTLVAVSFAVAAAPAMAAECKPLEIVDSLPLTPLPSGRPSVVAVIAGSPKTMLIDTGGAISAITQRTVRDLNLSQIQNGRALRGANGAQTNILARLPSIAIGRLQQANALYYVLPENNVANTAAGEFDGILGGEFLKQYDADFDLASRRLNLFSQDHCVGQVVYWGAPAVAVVPMQLDASNHIKLQMQLDGKRVDAILDTGASATFLNLTDAQRTFDVDVNAPDVEKVGEITGGYSASMYRRRFQTLAFGGVTIANPELILLPDLVTGSVRQAPRTGSLISENGGLPSVTLGMSILERLHVYVAYKERKLYITEAAAPAAAAPPGQ